MRTTAVGKKFELFVVEKTRSVSLVKNPVMQSLVFSFIVFICVSALNNMEIVGDRNNTDCTLCWEQQIEGHNSKLEVRISIVPFFTKPFQTSLDNLWLSCSLWIEPLRLYTTKHRTKERTGNTCDVCGVWQRQKNLLNFYTITSSGENETISQFDIMLPIAQTMLIVILTPL